MAQRGVYSADDWGLESSPLPFLPGLCGRIDLPTDSWLQAQDRSNVESPRACLFSIRNFLMPHRRNVVAEACLR